MRSRELSSRASRRAASADSAAWSARLASSGSAAASAKPSARTSSRRSAAHVASAAASAAMAFSAASSAFARAAFLPVKAAGISVKRSSLRRATGGARAASAAARPPPPPSAVASAASSPALASSHPSSDRLPKILLSSHTLTSFAHDLAVFSSDVALRVCFTAHSIFGHSASIHSLPFFREFCNTSFARYRKLSLRFPGAARSSFCHTGASVFARLRWNTHQCDSVSMLCGKARKARWERRGAVSDRIRVGNDSLGVDSSPRASRRVACPGDAPETWH